LCWFDLFIYLFIYYTVYTHVKSFTIVKNRKIDVVVIFCCPNQCNWLSGDRLRNVSSLLTLHTHSFNVSYLSSRSIHHLALCVSPCVVQFCPSALARPTTASDWRPAAKLWPILWSWNILDTKGEAQRTIIRAVVLARWQHCSQRLVWDLLSFLIFF